MRRLCFGAGKVNIDGFRGSLKVTVYTILFMYVMKSPDNFIDSVSNLRCKLQLFDYCQNVFESSDCKFYVLDFIKMFIVSTRREVCVSKPKSAFTCAIFKTRIFKVKIQRFEREYRSLSNPRIDTLVVSVFFLMLCLVFRRINSEFDSRARNRLEKVVGEKTNFEFVRVKGIESRRVARPDLTFSGALLTS